MTMKELIIKNKNGRELVDMSAWKMGFEEVDKPAHWEEGFSAHSLALFFTERQGQKWLNNLVRELFKREWICQNAEIEHQSKLDSYGGKHRMQDLALWGVIDENEVKSVFVAVEAKVLESFGKYSVRDEYEVALQYKREKNTNSKKPDRVNEIVKFLFPELTPYDEPVCNLRYQLLHYLTASIKEGYSYSESKKSIENRKHPDLVILPVLVFQTEQYRTDPNKAKRNKNDYDAFCKALEFSEEHVGDRIVFHKSFNNCDVYTLYEEVEL